MNVGSSVRKCHCCRIAALVRLRSSGFDRLVFFCLYGAVPRNEVVKSLFVYTSFPSHTFPASIAKILGRCAVAMLSGMLRLHLCDGAVASHRAQVMFASAHAHAN